MSRTCTLRCCLARRVASLLAVALRACTPWPSSEVYRGGRNQRASSTRILGPISQKFDGVVSKSCRFIIFLCMLGKRTGNLSLWCIRLGPIKASHCNLPLPQITHSKSMSPFLCRTLPKVHRSPEPWGFNGTPGEAFIGPKRCART